MAFGNPANEFVNTSIRKTRFYTNFFRGQMNPRAMFLATSVASRDRELLGTFPVHKNKEQFLVLNNKAVPSLATAPKFDRQKASTRISEKSVGRCYCFCDSFVVAKWLYGLLAHKVTLSICL